MSEGHTNRGERLLTVSEVAEWLCVSPGWGARPRECETQTCFAKRQARTWQASRPSL